MDWVRAAARRDPSLRFTALLHHVTPGLLWGAYHALEHDASPGVDGETWAGYGANLEERIAGLHARMHSGRYRASPERQGRVLGEGARPDCGGEFGGMREGPLGLVVEIGDARRGSGRQRLGVGCSVFGVRGFALLSLRSLCEAIGFAFRLGRFAWIRRIRGLSSARGGAPQGGGAPRILDQPGALRGSLIQNGGKATEPLGSPNRPFWIK